MRVESLVISAILNAMIEGPKIIQAWQAGEMTDEQAEAAWDAVVAPGWANAYRSWKEGKQEN